MRRLLKALPLVSLLTVAIFVACGEDDSGTGCTTDADCTETGTACHPGLQACEKTCAAASDCTEAGQNVCKGFGDDATADPKFCQCEESASGATDTCEAADSDNACNPVTDRCDPKCTDDTNCDETANETCDPTFSVCLVECDAGKVRDETGACVDEAQCTGTGKSTCTENGQICDATGACVSAEGTCARVAAAKSANASYSWDKPNAPVLFNGRQTGTRAAASGETCDVVAIFEVDYYDDTGDVDTSGFATKLHYVQANGVLTSAFTAPTTTAGSTGSAGTLHFELCFANSTATDTPAIFLDDNAGNQSNITCFEYTKP